MIKCTDSEGGYREGRTPVLPDYLCHSNDSVSEFTDKMVHSSVLNHFMSYMDKGKDDRIGNLQWYAMVCNP